MLTYIPSPKALGLFLVLGGALAMACGQGEDGGNPAATESAVTTPTAPSTTSLTCSVGLSDFAQNAVSKLESHFCADAKDGDLHANLPTTDDVQKEKDEIFMDLAFAVVDKKWDTHRGHPIAAVIVKDDKVVKMDLNSNFAEFSAVEHAEVRSIRAFFTDFKASGSHESPSAQLNKATLYGTLEPCQMCAGTINMSRMGRVVFGLKDNHFGDALDYLHSSPYKANFEENLVTRAAQTLTTAINAHPSEALTSLMEDYRPAFAMGATDLNAFQVKHPENAAALANAKAALSSL